MSGGKIYVCKVVGVFVVIGDVVVDVEEFGGFYFVGLLGIYIYFFDFVGMNKMVWYINY